MLKIVLQSTRTNLFLAADGNWLLDDADALAFSSSVKAVNFVFDHQLSDLQLVVCLEIGDRFPFPLPRERM
jgi:hypothetical protein